MPKIINRTNFRKVSMTAELINRLRNSPHRAPQVKYSWCHRWFFWGGLHLGYKKRQLFFITGLNLIRRTIRRRVHRLLSDDARLKRIWQELCNLNRRRKKTYWKKLECVGYDFKDKASTENEKRSKNYRSYRRRSFDKLHWEIACPTI